MEEEIKQIIIDIQALDKEKQVIWDNRPFKGEIPLIRV